MLAKENIFPKLFHQPTFLLFEFVFQKICPITRLPAKYFDPVTKLPYANLQAFRILREAYYSQLELKGDKSDPEVNNN
jgi:hypothetical protein